MLAAAQMHRPAWRAGLAPPLLRASARGPATAPPPAARRHPRHRRRRPMRPPPHSASTETAAPAPAPASAAPAAEQIDWRASWYAVAFEADVDKVAPYAFQLLGQRLVVWWDGAGTGARAAAAPGQGGGEGGEKEGRGGGRWRAFADACPHKLALLSEGRVVASTGELECPYHGWRFDARGACTSVPQASAPADPASSPRACATAFPCRAAQGVIFVKPTAMVRRQQQQEGSDERGADEKDEKDEKDDNDGDASSSSSSALPLIPELEEGGARAWLGEGNTLVSDTWRDVPLDYATVMSNLLDASHLPFTHHRTIGNRRVLNVYDVSVDPGEGVSARGFGGLWKSGPRAGAFGPQRGAFVAPNLMRQKIDGREKRGVDAMVIAYVTPSAPGRCRLLNRNTVSFLGKKKEEEGEEENKRRRRPLPAVLADLLLPRFATHLATQVPLEDDQLFLHGAEEELWRRRAAGLPDGRAQFLPGAPEGADAFERAFRSWLSDHGGGGPFGRPGVDASADLPPRLTRRELLDRHEQHTQGCATCSRALRRVRAAKGAARAAAGGLALLAVFCGACGVAGAGSSSSSAAAAAAASSSLAEWAAGLAPRALRLALAAGAAVAWGGTAASPEAAAARALAFAAAALVSAALVSALGRLEEAFMRGTWPPPRNLDKE